MTITNDRHPFPGEPNLLRPTTAPTLYCEHYDDCTVFAQSNCACSKISDGILSWMETASPGQSESIFQN